MILEENEVLKILKKPTESNQKQIESAKKHELELLQFYQNEAPEEVIFSEIKPLLTASKLNKFKAVFKNHPQTLLNKIKIHYGKVMNAHGKVIDFDFGQNINKDNNSYLAFKEARKSLYMGISDEDYWGKHGITKKMVKPSSFFQVYRDVKGRVNNTSVDTVKVRHINLSEVYTAEASIKGVEYIILKETTEENGKEVERFFTHDDKTFFIHRKIDSDPGFVLEDSMDHGFDRCPFEQVETENRRLDEYLDKRSILSDSVKDLKEYSILKTFYLMNKHRSAFPKHVRPELRSGKNKSKNEDIPIDPILENHRGELEAMEDPELYGSEVVIPIVQQGDETFISNFNKMHFIVEGDVNVLTFHVDDIKELKHEILKDCIGEGYGDSYRMQAVNKDQVASNFDDQESNLSDFKNSCEKTMKGIYELVARQSPDYKGCTLNLGFKWFLKSTEQLYKELELVMRSSSNDAAIQHKQEEVLLTDNRNNQALLDKHGIIKLIKPFASLTPGQANANRSFVDADTMKLYDHFGQALSVFEALNGNIESFAVEKNKAARMILIKEEMIRIINEVMLIKDSEPIEETPITTNK